MRTTNLLILIGNVGQEPRQVGRTVKLSVATDRSWTDGAGERKNVTDWVTVTFFDGKTAAFVRDQVHKGDVVSIQGRIAESSYERDGRSHYGMDVIANQIDLVASRGGASADG